MGDGGVLFGRNGWADLAGVYTVSRRSLEERGEVIRDHVSCVRGMFRCIDAWVQVSHQERPGPLVHIEHP